MSFKILPNSWIWTSDFSSHYRSILHKVNWLRFDGIEMPISSIGGRNVKGIRQTIDDLRMKEAGFEVVVIGGGTVNADLSSSSKAKRENGRMLVERCIRTCSELGGSLICGPLYTAVGKKEYLTERERQLILRRVASSIRELGLLAKDLGVRIALEPLCRYDTSLLNTVHQGMQLVEMISSDNVGLLLDTFQLNIEESSMPEAIASAGDKLYHFHACENNRGTPGSGLVDWKEVWAALRAVGYHGLISIESFTPYDPKLATKMHVWRRLAKNQDILAREGLNFLRSL